MNRGLQSRILIFLLASSSSFAGTSGISFVYQPLTTMGTDAEAGIIVAKVPIIASGPPANVLSYVSAPHQLPQRGPAIVEDSNLLSVLGISVSGDEAAEAGRFVATLDLSQMKLTARYKLTDEAVVKAALHCIRNTINEVGEKGIWKIRIVARPKDGTKWSKYETDYRPHPRK
ncbi:MAG: hypothetical protein ABR611_15430 [Chthoniobacterales bacterium]